MKKLILLLIIPLLSFGQDVRNAHWDMSVEEVLSLETATLHKAEDIFGGQNTSSSNFTVIYRDKIVGKNVQIIYEFEYNKLNYVTFIVLAREFADYDRFFKNFNDSPTKPSIQARLIGLKPFFNYFYSKQFTFDQTWIQGVFYSAIWFKDKNAICNTRFNFPIPSSENFNSLAGCIKNTHFNQINNHYGITATNGRTNILFNFPKPKSDYDFSFILGWIKFSKK